MELKRCDLGQLAELMGNIATHSDAEIFRDWLLSRGYTDTDELQDSDWQKALNQAFPRPA